MRDCRYMCVCTVMRVCNCASGSACPDSAHPALAPARATLAMTDSERQCCAPKRQADPQWASSSLPPARTSPGLWYRLGILAIEVAAREARRSSPPLHTDGIDSRSCEAGGLGKHGPHASTRAMSRLSAAHAHMDAPVETDDTDVERLTGAARRSTSVLGISGCAPGSFGLLASTSKCVGASSSS